MFVEPLLVKLDRTLKLQLRREAARQGITMSRLTRRVLRDYLDDAERGTGKEVVAALIERGRGSATSGMTTDEIMALTRGE